MYVFLSSLFIRFLLHFQCTFPPGPLSTLKMRQNRMVISFTSPLQPPPSPPTSQFEYYSMYQSLSLSPSSFAFTALINPTRHEWNVDQSKPRHTSGRYLLPFLPSSMHHKEKEITYHPLSYILLMAPLISSLQRTDDEHSHPPQP